MDKFKILDRVDNLVNTYNDIQTRFIFSPKLCLEKPFEEVQ